MLHFARGTLKRAKTILTNAPLPIQERFAGLNRADSITEARVAARRVELQEIGEEIEVLGVQLAQIERAERVYGMPESSEVRTLNPDRSETVILKPTGSKARVAAQLEATTGRRDKVIGTKLPKQWSRTVCERLADYRGAIESDDSEITLDQRDGESLIESHARKWGEVVTLNRNVRAFRSAPIPASDALALLNKYVDSHARAPDLGAFTRGEHAAWRGGIEFGPPPNARPTWPSTVFVPQVDPPDVVGILCWLLPDALKSAAAAELHKKDSPDAISVAVKREEVPKLEARLWQARRELELLTITGIAQGTTNLNRMSDVPIEILLNARPFGETHGLAYDPPDFENGDAADDE